MVEAKRRLLEEVDSRQDGIVRLLRDLVRIPSVTGEEGEIQRFVADYVGKLGLEVDLWESDWHALKQHPEYVPVTRGYEGRPNILALLRGTGGGRSLLLNGHTDTVPVGPRDAWDHEPLAAELVGGRVYGRGASDMKSGVAAMIAAIECFLAAGLRPKGDVLLNVVVDEELSGHGTLDTLVRGYTADAGICAETSENAVQPACIGRIWFEIAIKGKPAGIQRRYLGVNAIELGYRIVQAVAELEKMRLETVSHPLYPSIVDAIPCMIGSFEAGSFPSAFPDACLLKGSLATVPGEDHAAVKQSLVDQVARVAAADALAEGPPARGSLRRLLRGGCGGRSRSFDRQARRRELPRGDRPGARDLRSPGRRRRALPQRVRPDPDRHLRSRPDVADARQQRMGVGERPHRRNEDDGALDL